VCGYLVPIDIKEKGSFASHVSSDETKEILPKVHRDTKEVGDPDKTKLYRNTLWYHVRSDIFITPPIRSWLLY
jgi:hypothetical protein